MDDKLEPLSPARKLAQRLKDLEEQRLAGGVPEIPQHAGPMPTIYNVNTGEWDEVEPMTGRLLGVPIGQPVDADILSRMWGGRPGEAPLLNRDIERRA
jgi:hypothetical protein